MTKRMILASVATTAVLMFSASASAQSGRMVARGHEHREIHIRSMGQMRTMEATPGRSYTFVLGIGNGRGERGSSRSYSRRGETREFEHREVTITCRLRLSRRRVDDMTDAQVEAHKERARAAICDPDATQETITFVP